MATTVNSQQSTAEIWSALENVKDPEIPVLSVVDLGIVVGVELKSSVIGHWSFPLPLLLSAAPLLM